MSRPIRKTHPQSPLYYGEQLPVSATSVEAVTQHQEAITIGFPQITGQIADAQVPQSAVTQHEAALLLLFTQLLDAIADAQVPQSAVTQHKAAVLASAALTGVPTTPTPAAGDNTTKVASTAFVTTAIAGAVPPAAARGNVSVTTASLANLATENGTIALGKASLLIQVTGSIACRIRLYSTAAHRTADAARVAGTDPTGEHGVMLDVVLPATNLTWDLSPLAAVSNDDGPAVSNIYYAIQNMSGGANAVTATLSRITLEP